MWEALRQWSRNVQSISLDCSQQRNASYFHKGKTEKGKLIITGSDNTKLKTGLENDQNKQMDL